VPQLELLGLVDIAIGSGAVLLGVAAVIGALAAFRRK